VASTLTRVVPGLIAVALLAPPAWAQSAACVESGIGLYPGWQSLRYRERVRRCAEIERREWEAARRQNDPEWQQWREQECLVNAAACDVPGVHSAPPGPPPPPPPPPPYPSYPSR